MNNTVAIFVAGYFALVSAALIALDYGLRWNERRKEAQVAVILAREEQARLDALTADLDGMKESVWPLVKRDREKDTLSELEREDLDFMREEIKAIEEKISQLKRSKKR